MIIARLVLTLLMATAIVSETSAESWLHTIRAVTTDCNSVLVEAVCPPLKKARFVEFLLYSEEEPREAQLIKVLTVRCRAGEGATVEAYLDIDLGTIYSVGVSMAPDGGRCDGLCRRVHHSYTFVVEYYKERLGCEIQNMKQPSRKYPKIEETPATKEEHAWQCLIILSALLIGCLLTAIIGSLYLVVR